MRLAFFFILCFLFSSLHAEIEVPDQLDPSMLSEDMAYALPTPSQLVKALHQSKLSIDPTRDYDILNTNFKKLSEVSEAELAFTLGRVFALVGLSLDGISNENMLNIAQRIHEGADHLTLPENIDKEIKKRYNRFINSRGLNRRELILAFTEARSAMTSQLKRGQSMNEDEKRKCRLYATCLELGIWYQSLSLVLDKAQSKQDYISITEIFFMKDVIEYFNKQIGELSVHYQSSTFFKLLQNTDIMVQKSMTDKVVDAKEGVALKNFLSRFVFNGAK